MDVVRDIVKVILISACIGLCVGVSFQALTGGAVSLGAMAGSIAGATIGFISNICFTLAYVTFRRRPPIAFAVVILSIALGTHAFNLYWNVSFPFPGLLIIAVSEVLGIAATAALFYNYFTLNKKLKGKIENLGKTPDDPR